MDYYLISGQNQADNFSLTSTVPNLLWRGQWATMEPTEGAYNWTALDSAMTAVKASGGKLAIAVTPGIYTPAFVFEAGAQGIGVPLPWDMVYLGKWTAFVTALADRYAADPSLDHVVLPIIAYKTPATSLPVDAASTKAWALAGYTTDAILATSQDWNNIVAQPFSNFVIAPQPGGFPTIRGQSSSLSTYHELLMMAPTWANAILEADSGGPKWGVPPALQAEGLPTILQASRVWGAQVQAFIAEAEKTGASKIELYPSDAALLMT